MSASPLFTSYSIWGLVEMTAQVACSSPAVASAILIDTLNRAGPLDFTPCQAISRATRGTVA